MIPLLIYPNLVLSVSTVAQSNCATLVARPHLFVATKEGEDQILCGHALANVRYVAETVPGDDAAERQLSSDYTLLGCAQHYDLRALTSTGNPRYMCRCSLSMLRSTRSIT